MGKRRSPAIWLAALVATLTFAGCGSTTRIRSGATVRLAVSEYRVAPQRIEVDPGIVTIEVTNTGRLTHDLAITADGRIEATTEPIPPGARASLVADLTRGRYLVASTLFNDQALGAYGTLRVG